MDYPPSCPHLTYGSLDLSSTGQCLPWTQQAPLSPAPYPGLPSFPDSLLETVNANGFSSHLPPQRGSCGASDASPWAALRKDAQVAFSTSGWTREHHFELAQVRGLPKCPLPCLPRACFSAQACLRGSMCQKELLAHLNSQRNSRAVPLSATDDAGIWAFAVNANQPGRQKNLDFDASKMKTNHFSPVRLVPTGKLQAATLYSVWVTEFFKIPGV